MFIISNVYSGIIFMHKFSGNLQKKYAINLKSDLLSDDLYHQLSIFY